MHNQSAPSKKSLKYLARFIVALIAGSRQETTICLANHALPPADGPGEFGMGLLQRIDADCYNEFAGFGQFFQSDNHKCLHSVT
jgi:hypothetical protein